MPAVRPSMAVLNTGSPQCSGLRYWWPLTGLNRFNAVRGGNDFTPCSNQTPGGEQYWGGDQVVLSADSSYYFQMATRTSATAPSGTTRLSMSVWAMWPTSLINGVLYTWQNDRTIGTGTRDKSIEIISDKMNFYAYDGATKYAASTTSIVLGKWFLIVGTYDGTNLRCYVNGQLEATTACSQTYNYGAPAYQQLARAAASSHRLLLADVRQYTRDLSPAEVWALYDPRTRWDLYWTPSPSRYVYVTAATAAARRSRLALLGAG